MAYELKDYVEVADRIAAWYAEHPNGRISTFVTEFTETRVVVRAEVFRSDDMNQHAAGVGHSFLSIPGSTPYTRGAELENAETSAVGRALVNAGVPAKSVASAQEVRSKRSEGTTAAPESAAHNRVSEGEGERGPSEPGGEPGIEQDGAGAVRSPDPSAGSPAATGSLDADTIAALIKAWPTKAAATKAAHERYGVFSLAHLTKEQADELYDQQVGV